LREEGNYFTFDRENRHGDRYQPVQPRRSKNSLHHQQALNQAKRMLSCKLGGRGPYGHPQAGAPNASSHLIRKDSLNQQMPDFYNRASSTADMQAIVEGERFVNQNSIKGVQMVYRGETQPVQAKAEHVFKLQKSMRLATKFYGAQTQKGMKNSANVSYPDYYNSN
jgi:hypothetical protein